MDYNAVLDERFEEALMEARAADVERSKGEAKGLLHGIPLSCKDNISVKGLVTCYGLGAKSFIPQPDDANLIKALKRHGAIIWVKTNMCAGGFSAETKNFMFGSVSNPQDFKRTSGGSSGGEACLIGLKCSVAGIGTDSAGSVRIPASACGIVSMKATSGRIPSTAPFKRGGVPGNLSVFSPMARSVDDLELMYQSILDKESLDIDAAAVPMPWNHEAYTDQSKLVIGYISDEFSAIPLPECQKRAVQVAKKKLESLGHTLVEVKPLPIDVVCPLVWGIMKGKASTDTGGEAILDHYGPFVKAILTPKWLKYIMIKVYKKLGR